jgi:hypothetical protein
MNDVVAGQLPESRAERQGKEGMNPQISQIHTDF